MHRICSKKVVSLFDLATRTIMNKMAPGLTAHCQYQNADLLNSGRIITLISISIVPKYQSRFDEAQDASTSIVSSSILLAERLQWSIKVFKGKYIVFWLHCCENESNLVALILGHTL